MTFHKPIGYWVNQGSKIQSFADSSPEVTELEF